MIVISEVYSTTDGAENEFWPGLPEIIEPPYIDRLPQNKKDADYDNVPSAPHYIDTQNQRVENYPVEDTSNIPYYANTQSKYTESTSLTPFEDREGNPQNLTFRHRQKPKFPIAGLDSLRPIDERFCLNKIFNRNSSLSSPVECARTCRKGDRKICYYNFLAEYYMINGMACKLCIPNASNAFCSNCECVPADGIERSANIINRQLPGPAIEVCEGDHVVIDVTNHMPGSELTIHWHGLFQKEFQYYDGVPHITQCPIGNDNTFRYQWSANNPGTHFWHAHSGLQKMDGIFGKLIVRQTPERDPHSHLYDYDLSTHVLIINDWMHEQAVAHYPGKRFNETGQNPDSILINGKGRYTDKKTGITTNTTLEVIDVEPGKRYRIRIINAFCTVCPGMLTIQNHNLSVIATDGISTKPRTVDSITSFAGERYDIVLHANKPIGSYWIQVRGIGICAADGLQQLAILRYKGASNESLEPADYSEGLSSQGINLNPLNANCEEPTKDQICVSDLASVEPIDKDILRFEPDLKFYLPIGFYAYTLQELYQPNTYDKFMLAQGKLALAGIIDGISFKFPSSPPLSQPMDIPNNQYCNRNNLPENCTDSVCTCTHRLDIPLNAIVEIVLVDEVQGANLSHPFHMHGYAFYVMGMGTANVSSINWKIVQEMDKRNLVYRCFDNPVRKDTIAVPFNGYVVLRFRADNPGYWLFHCHFIYHQIVGMEMLLKVGKQEDVPPVPRNFPKCNQYLSTIGYNAYPPFTQSTYKP
ncbi:Laccase-4 [Camponotus floridanus]|uniref:Laccase-4 n=1 Tax=Camponotus floridanus TaxID=104421 RepID=E1ZWT8_CAMFO|nr:Laccase-4 [Camponotus floridanus]